VQPHFLQNISQGYQALLGEPIPLEFSTFMELIRGLHNLQSRHRDCVATIGNFDGVHRGHQAVIEQLRKAADTLSLPAVVILFEPQPAEFLVPEKAPARLMSLRDKIEVLNVLGVDRVLCLRFDSRLSQQEAGDFCRQILVQGLAVRHLVVGDDFRFGRARAGDFEFLCHFGRNAGFVVENTLTWELDGVRVSSTRVRAALESGQFGEAARLLGRPYRINGRVIHGDRIGRTLGVPTANLLPNRLHSPLHGVYAVTVDGIGLQPREGVANIGCRPTLEGERLRLEVHLFDFADNIYGQRLHVSFHKQLREERKFQSLEALKAQIQADIHTARQWFASLAR
jgi:riboflavin kinase/FMN adenylyltransferase